MNIAFAGATGAVGKFLLQLLVQTPQHQVDLLGRRELTDLPDHIQSHNIDFDLLPEVPINRPVDVAISTLGTTQKIAGKEGFYKVDHDYVVNFGKWALQCGAKKYMIITSVGANPQSWYSFYLKTKGETERDVVKLGFEEVVFVQPPLLEGPRQENRPTEIVGNKVMSMLKPLFVGPLKYSLPVHLSQVANCIFAEITNQNPGIHILGAKEIHQFPKFEMA